MNAEQLEELLAIANRGAFLAPSDASAGFAARAAAASDLAAKLQPITAEALLSDGWHCIYASRDDYWELLREAGDEVLTVAELRLFHTAAIDINVRGNWVQAHATTMYDLGELVRLLGGAA